jgi:hypothetical protein
VLRQTFTGEGVDFVVSGDWVLTFDECSVDPTREKATNAARQTSVTNEMDTWRLAFVRMNRRNLMSGGEPAFLTCEALIGSVIRP